MGFIVERVSVSMEKCSPYMYGMEGLFFCTTIKKRSSYYFHIIFSQSAVDGNLTRQCSSDISFFVSFFFSIISSRLIIA
jgi:hypothetical protein